MNNNDNARDRKRARDEPEQAGRYQRFAASQSGNQDIGFLQQLVSQPQQLAPNDSLLQHLLLQLTQDTRGSSTSLLGSQQTTNQPHLTPVSSNGSTQPSFPAIAPQSNSSVNDCNTVQQPASQSLLLALANAGAAQPSYSNVAASQMANNSRLQGLLPPLSHGLNFPQQRQSLQEPPQAPIRTQQQAPTAASSVFLNLISQLLLGGSGRGLAEQLLTANLTANPVRAAPNPPPVASNPQAVDVGALLSSLQQGATAIDAPRSAPTPFATVAPPPPAVSMSPVAQSASSGQERSSHRVHDERAKLLYVPTDEESVNAYQRFARQQIELFEAKQEDVDVGAQGRNKPIILGQVGIRCIHCSGLHPRFRARASVYYPSRLAVLYQAAQNIVNVHLPELCESIPEETRQRLLHLDTKRSAVGGGKTYWSDTVQVQGVIDTPHGLRFKDNPLPPNPST